MTNAEKYKEVFGLEPNNGCPTWYCPSCPMFEECSYPQQEVYVHQWWSNEYKEINK